MVKITFTTHISNIFILLLFLISLNGCHNSNEILFGIIDVEEQNSDFLFMAESRNVSPIDPDSLMYFLTRAEFFNSETATYKNYGKIFENERFRAYILLREGNKEGRDYN